MGKPEAIKDKTILFNMFKRIEGCLWEANIEAGLPRFLEVANFLFLKLLKERQQEALWESLKAERNKAQCLNEVIIPKLQDQYNAQNVFSITRIENESMIKKMVAILDKDQLASFDSDILGEAYQYFLRNNLVSKQNLGQYFTPRPIARILASLASPTPGDIIYDPFCGAGGLLVEAFGHIKEVDPSKGKTLFFGRDVSVSTRVAQMNAILHWSDHSGIEQVANTLAHPVDGKYSVGLANVPFARDPKNYPYNGLYANGIARKKTDVLCILHLFQSIQKGGRMVAIVPEGFLLGTERAEARRFLTDNANLRLVASLPDDTFLPYTHVKTAAIFFENLHCPAPQEHFWYFDVEGQSGLDILQAQNFKETPEEDLLALGYAKVSFDQIRQNQENWIGKHYLESKTAHSPYPLVPLGKLVTFLATGFSYKVGNLADNGIPLFTLKSIKKDFLPHCETRFLKLETPTDEKNRCFEGDILVALKDKNREAPILGRAAMATQKGVFSSDLVKVEIKGKDVLLKEYLYYLLKNDTYIKEIQKFSAGSLVKSVTLANMASIKIPLPPLSIQAEAVREFNQYEKLMVAQNETAQFVQKKCQEQLNRLWG